jgi:hypothetical protein
MTNAELDKYLCDKYPKIFVNRHKSMMETCMMWGFEVGPGWENILKNLCANIQGHIDWSRKSRARALRKNREWSRRDWAKTPHNYRAVKNIEHEYVAHVPEAVPQVVADQVKEKFGTLRFYYHGGDDYVRGAVAMAEAMSACTCEECGAPGRMSTGGWLSVRCVEHGGVSEENEVEPQ